MYFSSIVVAEAFSYARFGSGQGPIHFHYLSCTGEEESLLDCRHRGIGVHGCGHNEDASVMCYQGAYTHIHTLTAASGELMSALILWQILVVKKGRSVWLMEIPQQEELRFASVVYGVECVMTHGIFTMLELPAENLDYQVDVSSYLITLRCKKNERHTFIGERARAVQYFGMICAYLKSCRTLQYVRCTSHVYNRQFPQ